VKLPVEVWQRNKAWSFKHNSTEEIESITIDPDHVLPDTNTANNTWTADKGLIEKDVILDGYLGTFSTKMAPLKITFSEKNGALNVLITNYPSFTVESTGKNSFESKQAGLKFEFNDSLNGFDMIIPEGQKIPFTRDK
jgi:hypothetical protein